MVVPPILKGGRMEKRWQPMSEAIWCSPVSLSTSFIAEKIGRSGQPVQKPGGRTGTSLASSLNVSSVSADGRLGARSQSESISGAWPRRKAAMPSPSTLAVYSPAMGSGPLPTSFVSQPAFRRIFASACSI